MSTARVEPDGGPVDHKALSKNASDEVLPVKRKWYRSTFFNMTILGLCNFAAPGLWGAMNSLGAGGAASPGTVNAANSLTFCLMVVSCFLGSAFVNQFGVRATLVFGTSGYCIYAAGLYLNSKNGSTWLLLFGAATCGICAGLFWMIEGAIAISYPEPERKGKALGYWLCYRVSGQIIGGAINLGINAHRSEAGGIDRKVYLVFVALQAAGTFVGVFLSPPHKVQRRDGSKVELYIGTNFREELRATTRLFFSKKFILLVPLICQAVFSESFTGTYFTNYFTVRVRALGSFTSAILCMIAGLIEGYVLDRKGWSLKRRIRAVFFTVLTLHGGVWTYSQIIQVIFHRDKPTIDWTSGQFPEGFILYLLLQMFFQLEYLLMFTLVSTLVKHPRDIVRIAALLRGTESASQAVSYGVNSTSFTLIGASALNFSLWAFALIPAWIVVCKIGVVDLAEEERISQTEETSEGVMSRKPFEK